MDYHSEGRDRAFERNRDYLGLLARLGLDRHTPAIFQEVLDFSLVVPLYDVQITILTPFTGTPLYDRMLHEGRLLEPGRWDLCTLLDVNFQPRGMTIEEMRGGIYWLAERLYNEKCLERRRRGFFENAGRRHASPGVSWDGAWQSHVALDVSC